jgi:hypothetical protein
LVEFIILDEVRIQSVEALGTDAMGELGVRVISHIDFDLGPVAVVVADLFAGGADGQQPAQGLDFGERVLKFRDESLSLLPPVCVQ